MFIIDIYVEHSNLKLDKTYTYLSNEKVDKGCRVFVDFNHRKILGLCANCQYCDDSEDVLNAKYGYKLKYIEEIIDDKPLLNEELYQLGLNMAYKSVSPVISCFNAMLPSVLKSKSNNSKIKKEKRVRICKIANDLTAKQQIAYDHLLANHDISYHDYLLLFKSAGKKLISDGYVEIYEIEKAYIAKDLDTKEVDVLTDEQLDAYHKILNTDKTVSLLHGVTGSGKTSIFIALSLYMLKNNKQVIILVPEISLTTMMIDRFIKIFNDNVAIYHSGLNAQEKYEQYQRVKKHEVNIVVGTRSAVFMPFDNLGLIIIDEEHDESYKQDSIPCYDAKDIATDRAKYHNAKLLLASATPSLDSYARAIKHNYELVTLNKRYNSSLPMIEVVDMKNSSSDDMIISDKLVNSLSETINRGKQAIILINRRGYSNILKCKSCNEALTCNHCDLTLSYHADIKAMMCHTCGKIYPIPSLCPSCKSNSGYASFGYGSQRVQQSICEHVKGAKIIRMDRDTTMTKDAHSKILNAFNNKEANILLGTQMIAKGLDYPDVELVGIINGDEGLKRSDYKSVELCFDLLVQASGRSGRKNEGKVILQVFDQDHYAIKCSIDQDYVSFFKQEMKFRHAANYPPYTYMINILITHKKEKIAFDTANLFRSYLDCDCKILGPAKLLKVKDDHRFRLVLMGKDKMKMIDSIHHALDMMKGNRLVANIKVDVNG